MRSVLLKENISVFTVSILMLLCTCFAADKPVMLEAAGTCIEGIVRGPSVFVNTRELEKLPGMKAATFPATQNIVMNYEDPYTKKITIVKCVAQKSEILVDGEMKIAGTQAFFEKMDFFIPASYLMDYFLLPVEILVFPGEKDDNYVFDATHDETEFCIKSLFCFEESGVSFIIAEFSREVDFSDYEVDEEGSPPVILISFKSCGAKVKKTDFQSSLISELSLQEQSSMSLLSIGLKNSADYKISIKKRELCISIGTVSDNMVAEAFKKYRAHVYLGFLSGTHESESTDSEVSDTPEVKVDNTADSVTVGKKEITEIPGGAETAFNLSKTEFVLYSSDKNEGELVLDPDILMPLPKTTSEAEVIPKVNTESENVSALNSDTTETVHAESVIEPRLSDESSEVMLADSSEVKAGDIAAEYQETDALAQLKNFRKDHQLKNTVVVLDPGHGEGEPGVSGGRLVEKDFCYTAAENIRKYLEEAGMTVYLTRRKNTSPSPEERIAVAASKKADLFLGIHLASSFCADMNGIEVYHVPPAAAVKSSAPDISAWYDAVKPAAEEGILFAETFSRILGESFKKLSVNEPESAGCAVLLRNTVPSVIIEAGYVSSPRDMKVIQEEQYCEEFSAYVADALIRVFLSQKPEESI